MASLTKNADVIRWAGDPPAKVTDNLLSGHTVTIVAQSQAGVTITYEVDSQQRRGVVADRTAFAESDLSPNPPFGDYPPP